jgi:hypothetical protein
MDIILCPTRRGNNGIGLVTIHFCIHRVSLCHVEIPQAVMIRIRCRFGVQTVPPQESRRHVPPVLATPWTTTTTTRTAAVVVVVTGVRACVRACVRRMCTTFFYSRECVYLGPMHQQQQLPTTPPHGREPIKWTPFCRCENDVMSSFVMSYRY